MSNLNQRLAKGQEPAFVELYDQFGDQLFAYVVSRVTDSDSAKDIIQEVFARLIRYHRHFKRVQNVRAYLFQVTRNEIARWSTNKPTRSDSDTDSIPSEPVAPNNLEESEWISTLLSKLGDEDREIVSLKIFSELTFKELADIFEMPAATVATRYRRAIAKLEASLNEETAQDDG